MRTWAHFIIVVSVVAGAGGEIQDAEPCVSEPGIVLCAGDQELYFVHAEAIMSVDIAAKRLRWSVPEPNLASNIAVTTDAVAFAHGNGSVLGRSRRDGHLLWAVSEKSKWVGPVGHLVVAQTDRREGMIAVDDRTGAIVWRHERRGIGPPFAMPIACRPTRCLTARFSIDPQTGRELARWPAPFGWDVALLADRDVLVDQRGQLTALNADGTIAWRKQVGLPDDSWSVHAIRASPAGFIVLAASRLSVSARVPVRIMAFSPEGRAGWMHQVPGVPLAFCDCLHVSGNVALYIGGLDGTTAYDATDGRTLWSLPDATYVDGTTAVCVPGECYALGTQGPGTRVYRLDVGAGRLQEVMSVAGKAPGLTKR